MADNTKPDESRIADQSAHPGQHRNISGTELSGWDDERYNIPNPSVVQVKVGRIDSTQTSPISLWLAECERLMYFVFQESNFYPCMAVFYFDLVIFGTAVMLIYEDFDNVLNCFNPCLVNTTLTSMVHIAQ